MKNRIEIDSETHCVYVRFKRGDVARTEHQQSGDLLINSDLDASGEILGMELVGKGLHKLVKLTVILLSVKWACDELKRGI